MTTATTEPGIASAARPLRRPFRRLRWPIGVALVLAPLIVATWTGWSAAQTVAVAVGLVMLATNILLLPRVRVFPRLLPILVGLDAVGLGVVIATAGPGPVAGLAVLHVVVTGFVLPPIAAGAEVIAITAVIGAGLAITGRWPDTPEGLAIGAWIVVLGLAALVAARLGQSQRRQGRRLTHQSRRTQAILDTAVEGIITIDEQGRVRSFNPAAERMFGYVAADVLGQNIKVLMPEPYHSEHDDYLVNYLTTGVARIIGIGREIRGRRKDGSVFPAELAVSEVRLGEVRLFTGIVRDITERKRTEAELLELNEELRRQQQVLINHEKMAAMGKMAAGIAHEISNPLASLDSLLQLAARRPDMMPAETVDQLREQVRRIERVIREMREFAHPNEAARDVVEINDVVDRAIDMIRFDQRIRRTEVVRNLHPQAGSVTVMPLSIQQVLINLLMNALDAMESSEQPRLEVTTRATPGGCRIEITDNGSGIAPADLEHVFEPFFTTKPIGQGTGLGLSISYSIVERHGGSLAVRSGRGQGTTFEIDLPRTSRPRDDAVAGDS